MILELSEVFLKSIMEEAWQQIKLQHLEAKGRNCGSGAEYLPFIYKAQGSNPGTANKKMR